MTLSEFFLGSSEVTPCTVQRLLGGESQSQCNVLQVRFVSRQLQLIQLCLLGCTCVLLAMRELIWSW